MNLIEAKEKLQKDGYTWFNLKELDEEFYNQLLDLKSNETKNIKEYIKSLRADSKHDRSDKILRLNQQFSSFEKASEKKDALLVELQDGKLHDFSQLWFFNDNNFEIHNFTKQKYRKGCENITKYFFDIPDNAKFSSISMITYYDKDCYLENHSDGTGTGRICALLIYLNETYDENDGGVLILNNKEKVSPIFGNVAIIDLQTFDIPHMVTKVTGGIGRYAILSFMKFKENEFIDYVIPKKPEIKKPLI